MTDLGFFETDDLRNLPTFRAAYSDRTALLMARLAYRAYELFDQDGASFKAFTDDLCGHGFSGCTGLIDREIGTAGYVVDGSDIIAIVFRGTNDSLGLDYQYEHAVRHVAGRHPRPHWVFPGLAGRSARRCSISSRARLERNRVPST